MQSQETKPYHSVMSYLLPEPNFSDFNCETKNESPVAELRKQACFERVSYLRFQTSESGCCPGDLAS